MQNRASIAAGLFAVVVVVSLAVVWGAGVLGRDGSSGSDFPEGVYRYQLRAAEVFAITPDLPARFVNDAIGTFTWTIRDGAITLAQTDCACSFPYVTGRYTIKQHLLTVRWPKLVKDGTNFCSGDCTDTVRWSSGGKLLRFEPVSGDPLDRVFWGAGKPWVRISATS